jgi:hypothetical protein
MTMHESPTGKPGACPRRKGTLTIRTPPPLNATKPDQFCPDDPTRIMGLPRFFSGRAPLDRSPGANPTKQNRDIVPQF